MILSVVSTSTVFAAVLTQSRLATEIEKQVTAKLAKSIKGEVTVKALLVPVESFKIPDGELDVIVDLDNNQFAPKKYATVTIMVNGKKVKKFPTPLVLNLYKKVWVATENIERNKSLTEANFTLDKKDVTSNYSIIIDADKDISDYIAVRNIKSGEVIDRRYVMPRPDVTRNTPVSVVFDAGGVKVVVDAQSMQDGCIGDVIKVRSNEYKKYYTGKVISTNQILVKI